MKPRFSASDVASLLGRNPYRTKNETLLKVLTGMPKYKSAILGLKDTMGVKNEREIVAEASPSALKAMWKSVDQAVGATSDAQVENAISAFKQEHVRQVVQETLEGKRAPTCVALQEVVARVIAGQTTVENELLTLCVLPEVKMAIESTQEHQVLASEIQKRRGTKLEKKAEDAFAAETGKEISERNTFTQLECPEYNLIGYIDGYQAGRIVETKNRKRFWPVPPAYDFVQLRCYMRMRGKIPGVLLENFPGKPPRSTDVPWDDAEWESIHEGLCAVSAEIAAMTPEDASRLSREVFSR